MQIQVFSSEMIKVDDNYVLMSLPLLFLMIFLLLHCHHCLLLLWVIQRKCCLFYCRKGFSVIFVNEQSGKLMMPCRVVSECARMTLNSRDIVYKDLHYPLEIHDVATLIYISVVCHSQSTYLSGYTQIQYIKTANHVPKKHNTFYCLIRKRF